MQSSGLAIYKSNFAVPWTHNGKLWSQKCCILILTKNEEKPQQIGIVVRKLGKRGSVNTILILNRYTLILKRCLPLPRHVVACCPGFLHRLCRTGIP